MPPADEARPRILVMDGNDRNAALIGDFLEARGYEPTVVTDVEPGDPGPAEVSDVAFALVDLDRLGATVWEHCDRLADEGVPFVVLSGVETTALRRESRSHGASRLVEKPVSKQALADLVRTAIDS